MQRAEIEGWLQLRGNAHNLGHGDTTLLQRVYGKRVLNRADFVRRQVVTAAPSLRLEANG
jgi:hypothetical protein